MGISRSGGHFFFFFLAEGWAFSKVVFFVGLFVFQVVGIYSGKGHFVMWWAFCQLRDIF